MANPQKENGHIDIANEIAEKLASYRISGQEYQVLWVIWRKTWGWHKKEDRIALSQIEASTQMKRSQVCRAINKLVSKKILVSKHEGKTGINTIFFNKDYDLWVASIKRDTTSPQKDTRLVPKKGLKLVPKKVLTKERKEITKETYSDVPSQDIVEIISAFKEVNPSLGKWFGNTTQRGAISRLLTLQGKDKILQVVAILPHSNKMPYIPTITTPLQLEEKWAALEAGLIKKKSELLAKQPKVFL